MKNHNVLMGIFNTEFTIISLTQVNFRKNYSSNFRKILCDWLCEMILKINLPRKVPLRTENYIILVWKLAIFQQKVKVSLCVCLNLGGWARCFSIEMTIFHCFHCFQLSIVRLSDTAEYVFLSIYTFRQQSGEQGDFFRFSSFVTHYGHCALTMHTARLSVCSREVVFVQTKKKQFFSFVIITNSTGGVGAYSWEILALRWPNYQRDLKYRIFDQGARIQLLNYPKKFSRSFLLVKHATVSPYSMKNPHVISHTKK